MLTHIQIRDLAIIDGVEIDFGPALTVLTGETGAGKSILVDALQLASGGRAGGEIVRHGAERAEVAATFDLRGTSAALRTLLEEQSIGADDELILRRVITHDGKSRTYLNGQSVTLAILRDVASHLLEIHGQHEFQSLTRPAAQRALLDEFAGAVAAAASVQAAYREFASRGAARERLEEAARDRDARLDLLRYQAGELRALDQRAGEFADLLAESQRHANRGKLAEAAGAALGLLYESDEGNAHDAAGRALAHLRGAAQHDERIQRIVPLVEEATIQIAEAARQLSSYRDLLDVDPGRQEEVEQRLASIESLARKHRVEPENLPARADELAHELATLEQLESNLESLRSAEAQARAAWRERAEALAVIRRRAAARLGREITARMQTLGMAGGHFEVVVRSADPQTATPSPTGLDSIDFLVSANPGQPGRPVAKIASGGELARLSLAVQVACRAQDTRTGQPGASCMVFDEVDAGIGGAVAQIVGRELAALGASTQVVCVTHLAQVASQASVQLRVAKLTDGRTTRTTVAKLSEGERIEEIARMLGGVQITDTARAHAAEMIGVAKPARRARR